MPEVENEISDEAKQAHAEQKAKEATAKSKKTKAPLAAAKEAASPTLTKAEMASIDAEEKKFDAIKGTTKERIELLREVINNFIKLANKIVDRNKGKSSKVMDQKIQDSAKILNNLMNQYAEENKAIHYKVVIERDHNDTLIVDCGPSKDEAYGVCTDIRDAVNMYLNSKKDSLISVVSSQGERTVIGEAKVSTITAFSAQLHDFAPQFVPEKELQPLDNALRLPQKSNINGPHYNALLV